jgi:hypothetical protein
MPEEGEGPGAGGGGGEAEAKRRRGEDVECVVVVGTSRTVMIYRAVLIHSGDGDDVYCMTDESVRDRQETGDRRQETTEAQRKRDGTTIFANISIRFVC